MLTVWFIRHGESEGNVGLATSETAMIKLTARGIEQAERIALAFVEPPTLIVTSPYLRAKQTAQPTLLRFPDARHEEWPVYEFTFLSSLRYCNTTIEDRRPWAVAFWERCDPFYVDGEGAESFANLMSRIQQFLDRLQHGKEQFVAVFSHEEFIRAVAWSLLTSPVDNCFESMKHFRNFRKLFSIPNGAIWKVQFQTDGETRFSNIITSHLST
jgi:2,3-bisphosphoglycerate-dependent phosphoglycerate mutase